MTDQINKIREMLEGVTEGPWRHPDRDSAIIIQTSHITRDVWVIAECLHNGDFDAKFIAASRTLIPALLDALEVQDEALKFYADRKNFMLIFDNENDSRAEVYEKYSGEYSIGDHGVTAHDSRAEAKAILAKVGE